MPIESVEFFFTFIPGIMFAPIDINIIPANESIVGVVLSVDVVEKPGAVREKCHGVGLTISDAINHNKRPICFDSRRVKGYVGYYMLLLEYEAHHTRMPDRQCGTKLSRCL